MKIGDVVCLKSNPRWLMTIESIDINKINCVWVDNDGNLKKDVFDIECLQKGSHSANEISDFINRMIEHYFFPIY